MHFEVVDYPHAALDDKSIIEGPCSKMSAIFDGELKAAGLRFCDVKGAVYTIQLGFVVFGKGRGWYLIFFYH